MSEYMQGGALANDDLDFSAPRGRAHAAERSTAAVKSPALNVAIGVSAVAVLAGLALGMTAESVLLFPVAALVSNCKSFAHYF